MSEPLFQLTLREPLASDETCSPAISSARATGRLQGVTQAAASSASQRPEKPAWGAPCNGCGVCCLAESCEISVRVFGANDRCPALSWHDGRFWCALAEEQQGEYGNLVAFLLGVGRGCDSDAPEGLTADAEQTS